MGLGGRLRPVPLGDLCVQEAGKHIVASFNVVYELFSVVLCLRWKRPPRCEFQGKIDPVGFLRLFRPYALGEGMEKGLKGNPKCCQRRTSCVFHVL